MQLLKIFSSHVKQKKIVVILPAYNAEKALAKTFWEIPFDIIDEVILLSDASSDNTIGEAERLGIKYVISHTKDRGYGGNQKSFKKN